MKICFLSNPSYVHTQRWADYFTNRGHDVHIVWTPIHPPDYPHLKVHNLNVDKFMGPWVLKTTFALKEVVKKIQPDILHMHYLGPLVAPVLLGFHPFVVSVWGADILAESGLAADPWREKFLKKLILKRADAVIALSKFLAKATCEYGNLLPERVTTHYWGVDLRQFKPLPRIEAANTESFTIGFVKHLLPKYGPSFLLKAFSRVLPKYPSVKLVMIGEGPLRLELEHLAKELKIAHAVEFVGSVEHKDVPQYMANFALFVMPSIYDSETFGVSAIEAQAMKVPVIASRIGGIPEALVDGVTGLLVPPRDERALADAIVKLIQNPGLRLRMGESGRCFVSKHFDWEKKAIEIENLYVALLTAKTRKLRVA
jgi:L-malate glycosyltransferase